MKSFSKFEIRGINQEKLLNAISKKIKIFNISRKDKFHSVFSVSILNEKKVKKILQNSNVEILSIQRVGLFSRVLKLLTSWGVLAGVCFCFVSIFLLSVFVLQIQVLGVDKADNQEIVGFLNKNLDTRIASKINCKNLELELYDSFDDLSFVSVAIVGQTLIVNVKKEIKPDEMNPVFDPLLSIFDGKVTAVNLIQGTMAVKVGDIVQQGDILVYPFIENSDNQKMAILPKAQIFADVWISDEIVHNSSYEETILTGKKVVKNQVYLFGLKLYESQKEHFFEDLKVEESQNLISENNILPFLLKKQIIFETETRLVEESFESKENELKDKVRQNVLQKIDDCEIIICEDWIVRNVGNLTTVCFVATVNREIGEK